LVPKNNNPKDGSPLDMGQIDSEKMYNVWNGIGAIVTVAKYTMIETRRRVSPTEQILPD
jgi:hypothetical protein